MVSKINLSQEVEIILTKKSSDKAFYKSLWIKGDGCFLSLMFIFYFHCTWSNLFLFRLIWSCLSTDFIILFIIFHNIPGKRESYSEVIKYKQKQISTSFDSMSPIRKLLTFWSDSGPQGKQIPLKQLKNQKLWAAFTELSCAFMNIAVKSVSDYQVQRKLILILISYFFPHLFQFNSFCSTI